MEKNNSSVLDKIRNILGMETISDVVELQEDIVDPVELEDTPETEIKLAEATLEDGTIIYFDGELGVETIVYTDVDMLVVIPDGDYVLENGDMFSVVNGVIGEYTPMVDETNTEPEPDEEALEEINFEEKYNEIKVIVDELKAQLEKFNKQEVALKAEIEKLSAEPEVAPISQSPQATIEMTAIEKKMASLDAIRRLKK